jgi:hypothetical protein
MFAAMPELSLELGAACNVCVDATSDTGSERDTLHVTSQQALMEPDFQRPVWLSPEMAAFVIGALDWCLVPAAAAFAAYSKEASLPGVGFVDHSVAQARAGDS